MTRRKNPYPGTSRDKSRHGKPSWKFRPLKGEAGVPGRIYHAYGSKEFVAAYEALRSGTSAPAVPRSAPGTIDWLCESYMRSPKYRNLADISRRNLAREIEWLRREAGDLPFAQFGVRHVEALMAKKAGPSAANKVKKLLSRLFNHGIRIEVMTHNPARLAERFKENPDGYHTWTAVEIAQYRARHDSGTLARLAIELALNTGAARQDMAALTWAHFEGGRFSYDRQKTREGTTLPILPELAAELAQRDRDTLLLFTHTGGRAYKPESFGNWFKDRCREAGLPHCGLHGLRKAGATRLADHGATENEIAAYLAHANTRQAATYTRKANKARLADSGFAKLRAENVSNLAERLDNGAEKRSNIKGEGE